MTFPSGSVLITGASSGIGAVYADRLAARGHDLILVARNELKLTAQAEALRDRHGVQVRVAPADLSTAKGVAEIEALLIRQPGVVGLINNAGIGAVGKLLDSDPDEMERMVTLNAAAPMRLALAAARAFSAHRRGAIVNISSIVAIGPEILNGVYGGTKAFMLAFSRSLAAELADAGVQVQCVLPGATGTAFWQMPGASIEALPKAWVMTPEDLVDAALTGFDRGEFATLPSLADPAEWNAWEHAREAMLPHLSSASVAPRYRAEARAGAAARG
ncbi:SDR family oxidoreductase [uncultured Albimonas sp.]|uniref:SDR family NAD(P)-dependent oxidoreductase n=1 Tax=uncultured Albimonas sp. TaxID=1331701 RepID=UPI0030EB788E